MSDLVEAVEVAVWAYALARPGANDVERCELIVYALAAEGFLVGHSATPGGALRVVHNALES